MSCTGEIIPKEPCSLEPEGPGGQQEAVLPGLSLEQGARCESLQRCLGD